MSPSTNRQLVSTVPDQQLPNNGDIQRRPTLSADCCGDGCSRDLWSNPGGQIPRTRLSAFRASLCESWALSAHINLNVRLLEFCGFCWTTCALGVSNMSSESARCSTVTPGGTSLSTPSLIWVKLWARWLGMILVHDGLRGSRLWNEDNPSRRHGINQCRSVAIAQWVNFVSRCSNPAGQVAEQRR